MVTILVAIAASTATVAGAQRRPTHTERRAIAQAIGFRAVCLRIRVSTVRKQWAAAKLKNQRASCPQGDGFDFVKRRTDGQWVLKGSGPDEHGTKFCPLEMPKAAATDLRICG